MTDDPTQEERRLVWEGGEFHPAQRGDTELWIAVPKKEWDEAVEALRGYEGRTQYCPRCEEKDRQIADLKNGAIRPDPDGADLLRAMADRYRQSGGIEVADRLDGFADLIGGTDD